MDYPLNIAGLRILLRTPHEISISQSLRPFLCQPHEKTDCIISLRPCAELPDFSPDGVWHGPEYYDCHQGSLRVFHCQVAQTDAFAVTQLFENGNIEIRVLPEYLSSFQGTAGIFNHIGLETLLLQRDALLLHASLIKIEGKAIAFAGPSGIGKSTQADLWKTHLGAQILNGDQAILRRSESGWTAYGSPYAGTSGIYQNDHAPLTAIILLRQAGENRFRQLDQAEAFRHIYPELSVHYWDKTFVEKTTDLCLQLLSDTPIYLLECLPEESAALLAKKGLGL